MQRGQTDDAVLSTETPDNRLALDVRLPTVVADARDFVARRPILRPSMLVACVVAFTLIAGFMVTTQTTSRANVPTPEEDAIGAVLSSGGLYHVDVDRLDHRALVSSRINHLTETPDVVVIADRSWQLVQQDLRWGKQIFGAYVDALSPDDVALFLSQLSVADHTPEKVILGIGPDYVTRTVGKADQVASGPNGQSGDTRGSLGEELSDLVGTFASGERPRPGLTPKDQTLDTLFPDGSIVWSARRNRDIEGQNQHQKADLIVKSLRQKVEGSSFSQIVATGEVIADTKSRGVEVIIALTPLHPEVYGQIYNRQTAFRLHEGVEDLLAMARALDVLTLGSFEPFAAGCKDSDFASLSVPAPACLSRMLDAGIVLDKKGYVSR